TRDPDEEKLYVQDVIERDLITDRFGVELDPATTHVFICGNPAMIGSPTWEDDRPVFPSPTGACQLLHERGFDIDRHGHVGNVHTEKYW
ncbi:MAG TPA: ferredoxin--NADP reductase, partial [Acidimicrobiia bacterium]|nr:ferredoxin--NADP reductase [Acidimicrobiia bacterium]